MDDEIEFVQALPMAGTLNDEAVSNILISTVYTDRYTMQQQVGQFFFCKMSHVKVTCQS